MSELLGQRGAHSARPFVSRRPTYPCRCWGRSDVGQLFAATFAWIVYVVDKQNAHDRIILKLIKNLHRSALEGSFAQALIKAPSIWFVNTTLRQQRTNAHDSCFRCLRVGVLLGAVVYWFLLATGNRPNPKEDQEPEGG